VTDWIIPIVTSLISVGGAIVSVLFGRRAAFQERLHAAEQIATRFREPLLSAIFNLETRIYNIIELGFLTSFSEAMQSPPIASMPSRTHSTCLRSTFAGSRSSAVSRSSSIA